MESKKDNEKKLKNLINELKFKIKLILAIQSLGEMRGQNNESIISIQYYPTESNIRTFMIIEDKQMTFKESKINFDEISRSELKNIIDKSQLSSQNFYNAYCSSNKSKCIELLINSNLQYLEEYIATIEEIQAIGNNALYNRSPNNADFNIESEYLATLRQYEKWLDSFNPMLLQMCCDYRSVLKENTDKKKLNEKKDKIREEFKKLVSDWLNFVNFDLDVTGSTSAYDSDDISDSSDEDELIENEESKEKECIKITYNSGISKNLSMTWNNDFVSLSITLNQEVEYKKVVNDLFFLSQNFGHLGATFAITSITQAIINNKDLNDLPKLFSSVLESNIIKDCGTTLIDILLMEDIQNKIWLCKKYLINMIIYNGNKNIFDLSKANEYSNNKQEIKEIGIYLGTSILVSKGELKFICEKNVKNIIIEENGKITININGQCYQNENDTYIKNSDPYIIEQIINNKSYKVALINTNNINQIGILSDKGSASKETEKSKKEANVQEDKNSNSGNNSNNHAYDVISDDGEREKSDTIDNAKKEVFKVEYSISSEIDSKEKKHHEEREKIIEWLISKEKVQLSFISDSDLLVEKYDSSTNDSSTNIYQFIPTVHEFGEVSY